jgi:hypothetical protein
MATVGLVAAPDGSRLGGCTKVSRLASQAAEKVAQMEEPPAGLGATRDELRQLLGDPTDTNVTSRSQQQPMIWRYGKVEYHFGADGRVWLIE